MTRPLRHYKVGGCATCPFHENPSVNVVSTCSLQARLKQGELGFIINITNITGAPPQWCPLRSVDIKLTFADIKSGETSFWPKIEEKRPLDDRLDDFAKRMRARRDDAAE